MQRVRQSNTKNESFRQGLFHNIQEHESKYHPERSTLSWWWPLVVLAVGIVLLQLVYWNDHTLPRALSLNDIKANPHLFSGERSQMLSQRLQNLGPRVVGDYANEVAAPKILEDDIEATIKNAHPAQSILRARQEGSGAYILGFKPPFINIYENVQNVLVKVEGSEASHSVLVNCHYDSVPTSFGASDNAISCTAMLEIIRILSISPIRLKHNVVFLFNGAEESPLHAAHLFLQHPWSKQCRIVLNLEGAGVGGRNILFQSGPKNAWLFNYYASSVPYPHGQVLGEELFQYSLIPSDTDFRIFRDFGNMPGLDMAFWHNGFLYHTKYDHERFIPVGSHQNLGENILALVKAFGNAHELNDMKANSEGKMVYYDYLGWFMVSHSVTMNYILNFSAIALGLFSIILFIGFPWRWSIARELGICIVTRLITLFVSGVIASSVAFTIDSMSALVMPWYANTWLIFPLYWCPCLVVHIVIPMIVDRWRSKKRKMTVTKITQMNLLAAQIPAILILFISTVSGLRSGALIFLPVVSSSIANFIIHSTSLSRTSYRWIWVYITVHIPSLLFTLYCTEMIYSFFVPIFGRNGMGNNDLVMAILSAFCVFYVMSFVMPLMGLVKKSSYTIIILASISVIVLILTLNTYIGHPYKGESDNPRPQRYFILHTYREFRDETQNVRRNESGYLIFNQDRNSPRTMGINENMFRSLEDDCAKEFYCGLPLYTSRMVKTSPKSHWIPSGKPYQPIETELKLINNKPTCKDGHCDFTFLLYGPDRKTLTFAPRPGAELISWSLPTEIMPTGDWQGRPSYFLHIASGRIDGPTNVTLTFKVSPEQLSGNPIMDIGLTGNHVHHDDQRTDDFKQFVAKLPEWTQIATFISAYKFYIF